MAFPSLTEGKVSSPVMLMCRHLLSEKSRTKIQTSNPNCRNCVLKEKYSCKQSSSGARRLAPTSCTLCRSTTRLQPSLESPAGDLKSRNTQATKAKAQEKGIQFDFGNSPTHKMRVRYSGFDLPPSRCCRGCYTICRRRRSRRTVHKEGRQIQKDLMQKKFINLSGLRDHGLQAALARIHLKKIQPSFLAVSLEKVTLEHPGTMLPQHLLDAIRAGCKASHGPNGRAPGKTGHEQADRLRGRSD